jgi:RNA recognition motif-containing protein
MSDQNTRLFVGGLLYTVTKQDIREFFSEVANVVDVYLAMDHARGNNLNRGFAFVEMESPMDAEVAIRLCHNKSGPGGRRIGVRLANVGE